MKTILVDYKNIEPRFESLSMCLGYFDAVHLGHQKLIKYARKNAKNLLGLLTFDKPVSSIIKNGKSQEVITSLDDRFKIISKLGVDYYFVFKLEKAFLELSDMEFINLLKKMNVKEVFVGKDFRYGKDQKGTIYTLQDYFEVHVIEIEKIDDKKVSTEDIKNLIKNGDVLTASKLLDRNYSITGTIVPGNQIGRTIGFPTINLKLNDNYVLPKFGVYKTICYVDNVPHIAIANVGVRPTIKERNTPNIEVHLKNFKGEIKGDYVILEFVEFIREEMKFDNLEDLKSQIQKDLKLVF